MEENIKRILIQRKKYYENMLSMEPGDTKQFDFLRGKVAAIADLYYMIDRIERGDVNV